MWQAVCLLHRTGVDVVFSPVQAAHKEAVAILEARVTAALEATTAKEATVLERDATICELETRLKDLHDKTAGLQTAMGQSSLSAASSCVPLLRGLPCTT